MKPPQTNHRNIELAKIHLAKKQLALDDADYRLMLWTQGKVRSAADLDQAGRKRVLAYLEQLGFKPRSSTSKARPSRILDTSPSAGKARALWLWLHHVGAVRDPSEQALIAYAKRTSGVDAIQWATGDHMYKAIEGLKAWALRLLPALIERDLEELHDGIKGGSLTVPSERLDHVQKCLHSWFARRTFDPGMDTLEALQSALGK